MLYLYSLFLLMAKPVFGAALHHKEPIHFTMSAISNDKNLNHLPILAGNFGFISQVDATSFTTCDQCPSVCSKYSNKTTITVQHGNGYMYVGSNETYAHNETSKEIIGVGLRDQLSYSIPVRRGVDPVGLAVKRTLFGYELVLTDPQNPHFQVCKTRPDVENGIPWSFAFGYLDTFRCNTDPDSANPQIRDKVRIKLTPVSRPGAWLYGEPTQCESQQYC